MMRFALAIFFISAGAAFAADSRAAALALGNVLAAEQVCGFSYDQTAIEAFIDKNVDADDMNFAGTLNMTTSGSRYSFDQMGASEKTAACRQVGRVAKSYGFTR